MSTNGRTEARKIHGSLEALFLGGVTRRFPDLNFAFLEEKQAAEVLAQGR